MQLKQSLHKKILDMIPYLPMTPEQVLEHIGLEMPKYVLDKYLMGYEIKREKGVYRKWKPKGMYWKKQRNIAEELDKLYHSGSPGLGDDMPTGKFADWDLPKWHPRYMDVTFRRHVMMANLYKWERYFRLHGRQERPTFDQDPIPQYLRKAIRTRRLTPKEIEYLDYFTYDVVFGEPSMPKQYYILYNDLFSNTFSGIQRSKYSPEINEQAYRRMQREDEAAKANEKIEFMKKFKERQDRDNERKAYEARLDAIEAEKRSKPASLSRIKEIESYRRMPL